MKVLLMSFRIDRAGGAAEVPRMLARELVARGHEVTVITTGRAPRGPNHHPDGWSHYQVSPWNLYWVGDKDAKPTWQRTLWQLVDMWNPHAYRVVSDVLDRVRPDLVHVHKFRGLSAAVWSASKRGRRLPLVQSCHDYESMSPEGTLTTAVGRLAARRSWLLRLYQSVRAIASRHVDVVTAPTGYTLDTVTAAGLFRNAEGHTVPNSHGLSMVQLEDIRVRYAGLSPARETVEFLYLGRVENTKGVGTLCRAFDAASRVEPHLRLTIAGWGGAGDALKRQYADHPRIRFVGVVEGDHKQELLSTSDAIVVPSEWPEVFGIVVAEAFAFGCPAIASRVGGLPEVVEDGKTGVLFEPGDAARLESLLVDLARHPERLRDMRGRCFTAAESYSVDRVVDGYLVCYQRAMEHHAS